MSGSGGLLGSNDENVIVNLDDDAYYSSSKINDINEVLLACGRATCRLCLLVPDSAQEAMFDNDKRFGIGSSCSTGTR